MPWGTVAGAEVGATIQPTYGKKKADSGPVCHIMIHSDRSSYKINLTRSDSTDLSPCQQRGWPPNSDNLFLPDQQPGGPDAIRPVHHALASAGVRPLRRSSMGSADLALGRRARLQRGLDRRAPHSALGASSLAGSVDRTILDGNAQYPARARRVPAALP